MKYILILYFTLHTGEIVQQPPIIITGKKACVELGVTAHLHNPNITRFTCTPTSKYMEAHA